MNLGTTSISRVAVVAAMLLTTAFSAFSAQLYVETFDSGSAGWTTRDGEMSVNHDAGNDWLVGDYSATFLPQADAFRIASGSNFTGNYTSGSTNHPLTQLQFDLFAADISPSFMFMRLISGANMFSYQYSLTGNVGVWDTYTVDLVWSAGWIGVSESLFNSALTSVDAIEIEITRNTPVAQSYYLDNVETLNTELGDPGGPATVIPEPSVMNLVFSGIVVLMAARRRNRLRKEHCS